MKREEVKSILSQVGEIEDEILRKFREIQELRESAMSPETVHYTDMPKTQTHVTSKMEEKICDYTAQMQKLIDEKEAWEKKKDQIKEMISSASKPIYRQILRLRYLDRLHWHDIAMMIGYGIRNTQNLHQEALDSVTEQYSS